MKRVRSLLLLILLLGTFFLNSSIKLTFGADIYSDVFDDLRECENFEMTDYPSLTYDECKTANQPLLEVIQIAESGADELYLYVYEPTASSLDIRAKSISMSLEFSKNGEDLKPLLYDLKLLSSYKTLNKYLVRDFEVNDETYRYYNIVAIYRDYIKEIDDISEGVEETGNEKGISVGQQWCAYYLNDEIVYEMNTFNTLDVTIKFVGNVEFFGGIKFKNLAGAFDSGLAWFVCFDVEDYIVKKIFDADVNYKIREESYRSNSEYSTYYPYGSGYDDDKAIKYGDENYDTGGFSEYKERTLTKDDKVTYDVGGILSKEFVWNRISSSNDFVENMKEQYIPISDEVKTNINNSQWVFSFLETESTFISGLGITTTFTYDVSSVTIVRLHFMDINKKTYDLGVVADKVNPDNKSDINAGGLEPDEFFEKIM